MLAQVALCGQRRQLVSVSRVSDLVKGDLDFLRTNVREYYTTMVYYRR